MVSWAVAVMLAVACPAFGQQPAPFPEGPDPALAPAQPDVPVQRARFQQPRMPQEENKGTGLSLEPPGDQRLHQLDSESMLFERLRQEALQRTPPENVTFPEEPVLSREPYLGRAWPKQMLYAEPYYVNYQRLYFEELNSERYGWDLGVFSTLFLTANFYKDVVLFPYHSFTDPCRTDESSAGYCLPGDPVPYMLYPPGLSVSGGVAEAAAILAVIAIFP